ncbi:MAG: MoaD/ThiS family protein [Chloroflexi bacterium]|nr:MoaD/ThiS family protein [Chloroflexota bacterium]
MRVRVKLFATLRLKAPTQALPGTPLEIEVPEGSTLGALVASLNLPADEVKTVFVNGRARALDWVLEHGDEIGIFPPIGGG